MKALLLLIGLGLFSNIRKPLSANHPKRIKTLNDLMSSDSNQKLLSCMKIINIHFDSQLNFIKRSIFRIDRWELKKIAYARVFQLCYKLIKPEQYRKIIEENDSKAIAQMLFILKPFAIDDVLEESEPKITKTQEFWFQRYNNIHHEYEAAVSLFNQKREREIKESVEKEMAEKEKSSNSEEGSIDQDL